MITLSSELPAISDPAGLTIDGTGQSVAVSGDSSFRVMEVSNGAELDLVSVALIKGFAGPEGPYEGTGGGIKIGSYATVTISNSTIAGNTSSGWGGGIINNGSLTISNTTISGKVANTEVAAESSTTSERNGKTLPSNPWTRRTTSSAGIRARSLLS